MKKFLFFRDSSKKWFFLAERIDKSKDIFINLIKKVGDKTKFLRGKRFYQEISFIEAIVSNERIVVLYPSCYSHKRITLIFRLFIEKELGRHILSLIILILFLPFTAILGLLPGPNILFYLNISMVYIYFKALKGLRAISKKFELMPDETLSKLEREGKNEKIFEEIKEKFSIDNIESLKG